LFAAAQAAQKFSA